MNKLEKHYIYEGYGKPRKAKERILYKIGNNFRGLITIVVKKPTFGYSHKYTTTSHHYILDNTMWEKINKRTMNILVRDSDLTGKSIYIGLEDCL